MYIALMQDLCSLQPTLPSKFAIIWNNLLASSIIMASIATKCPTSVLASSALSELDNCFTLFETTARFGGSSSRPARALNIVSRIRNRAHKVAADIQAGILPRDFSRTADGKDDEGDELTILSGRARLVAAKYPKPSEISSSTTAVNAPASPPNIEAYRSAHPTLLDHLREATKSPQLMPPVHWSVNAQVGGQVTGLRDNQPEDNFFNIPIDLNTAMGNTAADSIERDTTSLSPPWDILSNGNPDGFFMESGTGNWETDWQAYMGQFGMPYVEGDNQTV